MLGGEVSSHAYSDVALIASPFQSAIILSASVTLMSFPGLDSITRIGGLVAITCSVLSMVSSFVSIFRYKAEMARGTGPSAEGFVMLSVRIILLCPMYPGTAY